MTFINSSQLSVCTSARPFVRLFIYSHAVLDTWSIQSTEIWLNGRAILYSHLVFFRPFSWLNGRALSCYKLYTLLKFPKLSVCCVMTLVVNIGDNVELIVKIYCTVYADWNNMERQRVYYFYYYLYLIMDLCFFYLCCFWNVNGEIIILRSVFEHCIHV